VAHWQLLFAEILRYTLPSLSLPRIPMSRLNLSALTLAIAQLEKGMREVELHPDNELMRDGVIQRFEYTMDLAWKMMQRYSKLIQLDETSLRSKNDLFREMARIRLIENAEAWIGHYAARNETSHDYDLEKAAAVFERVKLFFPDVKTFANTLMEALNHAD
jgi:nucleotidyltransferase substrate binding protein (TIGR01987 family)